MTLYGIITGSLRVVVIVTVCSCHGIIIGSLTADYFCVTYKGTSIKSVRSRGIRGLENADAYDNFCPCDKNTRTQGRLENFEDIRYSQLLMKLGQIRRNFVRLRFERLMILLMMLEFVLNFLSNTLLQIIIVSTFWWNVFVIYSLYTGCAKNDRKYNLI